MMAKVLMEDYRKIKHRTMYFNGLYNRSVNIYIYIHTHIILPYRKVGTSIKTNDRRRRRRRVDKRKTTLRARGGRL